MTIPQEEREEARGLYVIDGLTFDQVAKATGISASTLKNWSVEDGWQEHRRQYRKSLHDIRANTIKLRKKLIAQALENLDPQTVYAAVRLESVAARQDLKKDGIEPDIDRPKIFLEDMEFIVSILQEIDPEGLKVFARNFDLIVTRFKEKHAQTT